MHDLEDSTTRLGKLLRTFQSDVCPGYQTFDLPTEEAARVRRKAAAAKKGVLIDKGKGKEKETSSGSRKIRTFNLNTYKTHALGAYAKAIRRYGSPNNYNSQTVCPQAKSFFIAILIFLRLLQGELEHRRGKRFFRSVRKGKHAILGIGLQVRRQHLIHQLKESQKQSLEHTATSDDLPTVPFEEQEMLPPTSPSQHHHISIDNRQKVQISQWLHRNKSDPAVKVCRSLFFQSRKIDLAILGLPTTSQEPPSFTTTWL